MPRRPDGCNRNQRLLLKRSQIAENIPDKILKSNLLAEDKIIFMERGRQPAPGFCRWGMESR